MQKGEEDSEAESTKAELELYTEAISNSVMGWSLFVDTALESNIYHVAREAMGLHSAARIALFRLYLEGFTPEERERLLDDPDYFLQYAFGVVRELYPPHTKNRATILHNRLIFLSSVRRFLAAEKKISQQRYKEALQILRATSGLSRSVEDIVRARDEYKEFRFRIASQKNLEWVPSYDPLPLGMGKES